MDGMDRRGDAAEHECRSCRNLGLGCDLFAVNAGPILASDVLDFDVGRRHLESCVAP